MEWYNVIFAILGAVLTFVTTGVPLLLRWWKSIKAYRDAKTEAEAEKAYNDMQTMAQSFIEAAEVSFKGFDTVMKQQGSSAGAMKKESVTTKLQAYALSKGYEFDAEFWSAKIDEIVKFTREVNTNVRK